ncbi:MAG: hypothetical protein ACI92G_001790 [Candidatus Pelagisphaera sp.]|jgi:hypothetical protein
MIRNLTLSSAILAALSAQILRSVFVIKFQTSYLRRTTAGFALFLVGLTSSTLEVKAVLVSGLTIVSADEGTNDNMTSSDAIDGTGLPGGTPALTGAHSATWKDHWWSKTLTPQITIDLGATYSLTGAHIWNYNEANQTGRGLKEVIINDVLELSYRVMLLPLRISVFSLPERTRSQPQAWLIWWAIIHFR